MIKSLKAFFLGRLLREKLLLVVFILIGAAMWLSGFSNRVGIFWRQQKVVSNQLKDQALWLQQRTQIDASAQQAVAKLDPGRTLNATALLSQITAMAADLGLRNNVNITDMPPERTPQFAVNSLQVSIAKADFATVVKLYLELQKRSPYIGLDEFVMNVDASNRNLVGARFHVSSVEVIR
jgi:hypothetical protein